MELSALTGLDGFVVNGAVAYDQSGYSVASAGDVNGDGIADLVIGANNGSPSGRILRRQELRGLWQGRARQQRKPRAFEP